MMRMAGHLKAKNTSKTKILLLKVRIARIGDPVGPLSELFSPSDRAEDSAAAVGTVMD